MLLMAYPSVDISNQYKSDINALYISHAHHILLQIIVNGTYESALARNGIIPQICTFTDEPRGYLLFLC